MITDVHLHIGDFPLFNVRLDGGQLAGYLAENAIDTGIVFSTENALVREVVHQVPNAYGLYWANPKRPGALEEAREYLDDPVFRGIKLHPLLDGYHPNEPFVWPFLELLIERDLPVLVHCGTPIFTEPWSIEELITRYEDAKVILGHMGHTNIVYIDGAIAVASRHPNVWLETSGQPMSSKILEAVEKVGADRVMYGSDGPFHHPKVEQLKVQLSGLDETRLADVMHNTAQRLFFGT
jgi:predicted TIM-barrel fold metal-dependent hydrolase